MVRILVQEVRIEKNMSLRELAAASSISKTYISEIENGKKNPTLNILCKLAKALNVDVNELFQCSE
mgnify:CR=1 FL=1